MQFGKRGALTFETIIVLILLAVFLGSTIFILVRSLTDPQFTLGISEQACRSTLAINQVIPLIKPLCSTHLIPFTEKDLKKQQKGGETTKDTAARLILEYMQRCKDIVQGPKRRGFLSEQSCYVCYSLHTDSTTPFLTDQDLAGYSLRLREPNGKSFFFELRSHEHSVITFLDGGLGTQQSKIPSKDKQRVDLGKDYGITYASINEGSFLETVLIIAGGVGACAAGSWFVGYTTGTGPVGALAAAPSICSFSLKIAGAAAFLNALSLGEDGKGALLFTDYNSLDQQRCSTYVS